MNTIHRNPNERGSAILLVLGFLSLLLMMAMIFATTSRNAQIAADAKADETNAQLQARSAVTQAQETVFFLQNKGNIIGSVNTDLGNCLPENADIDQSPSERESGSRPEKFYYGEDDNTVNSAHLGIQPYVGYTTNELPNSWRFLAFYGELAKDAYATTPFGITFPDATKVNPYQSIYYSHATEDAAVDFDEVDYQGDNSLYEIVKNTKLGNLYYESTGGAGGQFEQLLKNDVATQLQFRNFFEKDEEDSTKKHVFSRQGFIMFNEGSKFDVNRLVSPGMTSDTDEPYLPYLLNGGITLWDKEAGAFPATLNIDDAVGTSTYAIMGREYAAGEYTSDQVYTSIDEDLTVQYGLHPAELQTRIVSDETVYEAALNRQDANKAPRWFTYEQMLSDTTNTDLIDAIKEDIFTLGVEGGTDDRELRFNGQYASMTKLLESIGTLRDSDGDGANDELAITNAKINSLNKIDLTSKDCSYLAKTNIAFPWGVYCSGRTSSCPEFGCANPTWDDIGDELATVTSVDVLKDKAEHFFQQHLGLNYVKDDSNHYLFKDDSGRDKTPDVFVNLTDFCDSDNAVTYIAQYGAGSELEFNTKNTSTNPNAFRTTNPIGTADLTTDIIQEPEICGNERVPAIIGVNAVFDLNASSSNLTVRTDRSMESDIALCRMTVNSGNLYFTPTISICLQNFFNETLTYSESAKQEYRVIIEGEIVPLVLAKKIAITYSNRTIRIPFVGEFEVPDLTTLSRRVCPCVISAATGAELAVGTESTSTSTTTDYDLSLVDSDSDTVGITSFLNTNSSKFRIDEDMPSLVSPIHPLVNIVLNKTATPIQIPVSNRSFGSISLAGLASGCYFHTSSACAMKITKIVVMSHDSTEASDTMSELVYVADESTNENNWSLWKPAEDTHLDVTSCSNCSVVSALSDLEQYFVDGASCKDPRMNHKSSQWVWMKETDEEKRPSETGSNFYRNGSVSKDNYTSLATPVNFAEFSLETVKKTLRNRNNASKDWEPQELSFLSTPPAADPPRNPMNPIYIKNGSHSSSRIADGLLKYLNTTISTYFIANSPISSLWQLGAIHRGTEGQTINLKAFGTDGGTITHEYADGDAWILDYLKLNELDANHGIRGKFNPNCFNAGAYRFLFANIPANERAKETMVYANGYYDPTETTYDNTEPPTSAKENDAIQRNSYYKEFIGGPAPSADVNLENTVFSFNFTTGAGKTQTEVENILASQSWSPVQAFFNFVNVDGGGSGTYACNDRQAESLIGCTAGLLSTRYEVFTAIAVGQSVKFLMSAADMNALMTANDIKISPSTEDEKKEQTDFLNRHFTNPIEIDFMDGSDKYYEWYSILSTQVREVTFVRDCWFGKITVLKSRLL